MGDEDGIVREVSWDQVFPWLGISRALRVAADPRKVLLALVGLVAVWLGRAGIDLLFAQSGEVLRIIASQQDTLGFARFIQPWVPPIGALLSVDVSLYGGESAVTTTGFVYAFLVLVWMVAVWAVCGGMITRLAAVELAVDERLSLGEALRHVRELFWSYLAAPLSPLVALLIACVPLALAGLIIRADVGLLVVGLAWPLLLLAGLFMTLVVLGVLLGWPLMWVAISAEGSDGFDAVSRSYSYVVFHRPLHYVFYWFVAALIGLVAAMVAAIVATLVVQLTAWGVSWGSGTERANEALPSIASLVSGTYQPLVSSSGQMGGQVIGFWIALVALLAVAYLVSYFWSAATAIYFLMRYGVDGAETDEVFLRESEERFGLPELEPDEAGVSLPLVTPPDAEDSPTPETGETGEPGRAGEDRDDEPSD